MLPEIETERLILRELSADDREALRYQSHPDHWRLQAVDPRDFADPAQRIAGYLAHRGEHPNRRLYAFVARAKADGRAVGSCSLQGAQEKRHASLGLSVAATEAGRGYGRELARAMLAFGFGALGLDRVTADVAVENEACIRLLEAAGLRREGVTPDAVYAQGRWWTEARYTVCAGDLSHVMMEAPGGRARSVTDGPSAPA